MNESGVLRFQTLPTGRVTYKEANSLVGSVSSPLPIILNLKGLLLVVLNYSYCVYSLMVERIRVGYV